MMPLKPIIEEMKFIGIEESGRTRVSRVDEVDDGAIEVDDPEDTSDFPRIIGQVIERSPSMRECEGIKSDHKRIGTVLQYPEFRIVWKRKTIKIGCVKLTIKYPQLQTRTTKRVLYAILAYPFAWHDNGKYIPSLLKRIRNCSYNSWAGYSKSRGRSSCIQSRFYRMCEETSVGIRKVLTTQNLY